MWQWSRLYHKEYHLAWAYLQLYWSKVAKVNNLTLFSWQNRCVIFFLLQKLVSFFLVTYQQKLWTFSVQGCWLQQHLNQKNWFFYIYLMMTSYTQKHLIIVTNLWDFLYQIQQTRRSYKMDMSRKRPLYIDIAWSPCAWSMLGGEM